VTSSWLQAYLAEAVRKKLCTEIMCTTCGAREFRLGVVRALRDATVQRPRKQIEPEIDLEVARALAEVTPYGMTGPEIARFAGAVRCILSDLWSGAPILDSEIGSRTLLPHSEIEALLGSTWAGDLLHRMKEHHEAREAERRTREVFQNPANVQKRREEKKRLKQEQHKRRLALKQERDRLWRVKHGKAN